MILIGSRVYESGSGTALRRNLEMWEHVGVGRLPGWLEWGGLEGLV